MKVNHNMTTTRRSTSASAECPATVPAAHVSAAQGSQAQAAQAEPSEPADAPVHMPKHSADELAALMRPTSPASLLNTRFAQHSAFFRAPQNDDAHTREKITGEGGAHILLRKDPDVFAQRARRLLGEMIDLSTAPEVMLHGDAHVEQYVQSGARFGLSDMDHARRGVWAEDVVRLLSSVFMKTEAFAPGTEALLLGAFREAYLTGVSEGHAKNAGSAFTKSDELVSTREYLDGDGYMAGLMRKNPLSPDDATLKSLVTAYAASRDDLKTPPTGFFKIIEAGVTAESGVASRGEERFLVVIDGQSAGKDDDIFLEFKAQTRPGQDTVAANALYHTPEAHQGHCDADGIEYWVHEIDGTYKELETFSSPAHAEKAIAAMGRQLGAAHGASTVDRPALSAHVSSFLDECSIVARVLTDEVQHAQQAYVSQLASL